MFTKALNKFHLIKFTRTNSQNGRLPSDEPPIFVPPVEFTISDDKSSLRVKQISMFIVTYLCYAALYGVRKPFSVVKGEVRTALNVSTYFLGVVDTAFLASYALGQILLSGYSARIGVKTTLIVSYVGSAVCTMVFGLAQKPTLLVVMWLLNGIFQSTVFPNFIQV
eukprot:Platyproteum_vivax@DN16229_c0_g1_i1.p1